MNWKEFFKPTIWKIIIFIILIIFSLILIYKLGLNNLTVCLGTECPTIEESARSLTLLSLPFILIVGYLISCLIIYVYNKIRKNA